MAQAHNGLWCRRANVHAVHNTRINFHGVLVDGYLWGGKIVEMRTIRKYTLSELQRQYIEMPLNAEILCAQVQGINIVLYAMVETDNIITKDRTFAIHGAGWDIGYDNQRYISTVMMPDGLVFHIAEILY